MLRLNSRNSFFSYLIFKLPPPHSKSLQAFFIGVQIEVEDAEVLPFPTTRQTLQELLVDEEEKDFWDDAELAPAQESAVVAYERAKAEAEELSKMTASDVSNEGEGDDPLRCVNE